ncbi:MAG: hypothetical protein IT303_19045 [Dehalococcoidia bacterium]|nr:hypothetical protein [Dehalococcoidia bacterium]
MIERVARGFLTAPRLWGLSEAKIDPYTAGMVLVLGLGILVRAIQVVPADFPLNDGGMFYAMTRDLQANGYRLPEFTSYNGGHIPFAYPPLAFYVTGLVDDALPVSLVTLFRVVPLLVTCATLFAFWGLARATLESKLAVLAAVAAFTFIPRSFIWLIMGGGATRSFGLLFAILALTQAAKLYRDGGRRPLVLGILLSAATILSHLQTGWFLAFSTALFWAFLGPRRSSILPSALLAGGTLLLTAPWWGTVMAYHGAEPFLAANGSGGTLFGTEAARESFVMALARSISTSEPFFPLIAGLGLLGGALCFARHRLLFPAWWLVIILLDVRAFTTYAALPIGLLAGIAVADGLVPLLQRLAANDGPARWWASPRLKVGVVLVAMLYFVAFSATVDEPGYGELRSLQAVPAEQRDTMAAITRVTRPGSAVLIIPGRSWEIGNDAEWLPVLGERVSVATVQGSEWLPGGAFDRAIFAYNSAWRCANSDVECLNTWAVRWERPFAYVYLPTRAEGGPCCTALAASMRASNEYRQVYQGPGGEIFERLIPELPGAP